MFFIFLVICIIIGGAAGWKLTDHYVNDRVLCRDFGYKRAEIGDDLSWPAWQILRSFNKLPIENRPDMNILTVVKALDTKYGGVEKVDNHFMHRYSQYTNTWDCRCNNRAYYPCDMENFHKLNDSIQELHKELADQTYALEMAKLAGNLQDGDELINALREEKKLIAETTKELTQRSSE